LLILVKNIFVGIFDLQKGRGPLGRVRSLLPEEDVFFFPPLSHALLGSLGSLILIGAVSSKDRTASIFRNVLLVDSVFPSFLCCFFPSRFFPFIMYADHSSLVPPKRDSLFQAKSRLRFCFLLPEPPEELSRLGR